MTSNIESKVAVVTITYYNPDVNVDFVRMELARDTIRKAAEMGFPVYIVDAGSPDELLKDFESVGANVKTINIINMAIERIAVFKEAYNSGHNIIAWMEPEKESYVDQIVKTAMPIIEENVDLVIPKRMSMSSYPDIQVLAECAGNKAWYEMTGHNLDYWFGPKTMNRDVASMFINYDCKFGTNWESIHLPVLQALYESKKVISVDVDFHYPHRQVIVEERIIEMNNKRMQQLTTLVAAGERYMNHLRSRK